METNSAHAHIRLDGNRLIVKTDRETLEKSYADATLAMQEAKALGWVDEAGPTDGRGHRNGELLLSSQQPVNPDELRLRGFTQCS